MRAYIKAVTPFHVPKSTVVFPRHPHIAQALCNRQDAPRQWAAKREPSCRCEAGHAVASGFHFQCGLSTLEKQVISGSSGDTFFPGKAPVWEQFRQAWASCCNDLPGPPRSLEQVFHAMWSPHAQTVASKYKYHNRIVDNVKSKTEGAIWRCEDHQPRSAVCYCPVLYHNMLGGTLCNKNVFRKWRRIFDGELRKVQKAAKRALQRRYRSMGFPTQTQSADCLCAA